MNTQQKKNNFLNEDFSKYTTPTQNQMYSPPSLGLNLPSSESVEQEKVNQPTTSNLSSNLKPNKPSNLDANINPNLNTNLNTNLNNEFNNLNSINQDVDLSTNLSGPTESFISSGHRIAEFEMGERKKKTALLVVNVQNCFFRHGAFSVYPSKDIKDDVYKEKELIRRINQLISLFEEDVDYFNAGLAGSPVIEGDLIEEEDDDSGMTYYKGSYPTGTRKKYFFDNVIYTQTAYPPDHFGFASHHFLREKKKKIMDLVQTQNISLEEAQKRIIDDSLDKHFWAYVDGNFTNIGMNEFDGETKLFPDHALIDGSDSIIENQVCYRGIEFHPRLNTGPLFRPNNLINQQVYINQPEFDGRGKIVWLAANQEATPRSAFMNSQKQSTGLADYLKSQKVEKLYVVGLFRDMMVESTLMDAIESGFDDVSLIYDATLPFGAPQNETKVNNRYYFKDQNEISKYLETISSEEDETEFLQYVSDKNPWAENLKKKNIKIINGNDVLDLINVGKSEFSCGFNPENIVKNFDIFLKTGTSTSRLNK